MGLRFKERQKGRGFCSFTYLYSACLITYLSHVKLLGRDLKSPKNQTCLRENVTGRPPILLLLEKLRSSLKSSGSSEVHDSSDLEVSDTSSTSSSDSKECDGSNEENESEPDGYEASYQELNSSEALIEYVDLTEKLDKKDGRQGIFTLLAHRCCAAHLLNLFSTTDLKTVNNPVLVALYNATVFCELVKKHSYSAKTSDCISSKLGSLFEIPNSTR